MIGDKNEDVIENEEQEEVEADEVETEEDEQEEAEEAKAEEPAKKPRKPRAPRKSKAEKVVEKIQFATDALKPKRGPGRPAKPKVEEPAPKRGPGRPSTKVDNFVEQDGSVIIVNGPDVYCRRLSPTQREKWGIRRIESGRLGVPCAKEPLVLKFKSPKSAFAFFNHSFTTPKAEDEIIVAGTKTNWRSESLSDDRG